MSGADPDLETLRRAAVQVAEGGAADPRAVYRWRVAAVRAGFDLWPLPGDGAVVDGGGANLTDGRVLAVEESASGPARVRVLLGTGAVVDANERLILTNYHVIEGAQFVEMKLYNGMETFGKVIKSDVRLDLALVKVQTRGNPLPFFEENTLDLGATVEAIGHPKGLTFTITRGIVSALRKKKSIYAVGGKEVMFVQTDAAINPGNSGGPLFLNKKVIGVNNNKLAAGSEGLGFAVHYSELRAFMKESF